jgi:hypothetical protein
MYRLEILKPHFTSQGKKKREREIITFSTLDSIYSVQIPYLWFQIMNTKHVHHHVPCKFISILDISKNVNSHSPGNFLKIENIIKYI